MSSKITIAQVELANMVQAYFTKRMFRPGLAPIVRSIRPVEAAPTANGEPDELPDFVVEVDPPAVAIATAATKGGEP